MSILKRLFNIAKAEISSRSENDVAARSQRSSSQQTTEATVETHANSKEAEYYANLELPLGASYEEITKAYKTLLKKYHPDFYGQDEKKRKIAEQIVQKLNEAKNFFDEKYERSTNGN